MLLQRRKKLPQPRIRHRRRVVSNRKPIRKEDRRKTSNLRRVERND